MSTASEQPLAKRLIDAARLGGAVDDRQPSPARLVLATALSLAGSLGADALLVAVGEAVFPSTRGFAHFRLGDYGLLTVIGVLAACAGWPVVARLSWAPRWLFFRLAIAVTLVLWLPDVWILLHGEPPRAVAVLIVMHLAIAVVTYNALVHLAPATSPRAGEHPVRAEEQGVPRPPPPPGPRAHRVGRAVWATMAALVGAELVLGIAVLLVVPFGRGDVWVPRTDRVAYLLHAVLGAALGVGSLALLVTARRRSRLQAFSALTGFAATAIAALGGVLSVYHSLRLLGLGLMLLGALVAGVAYLAPVIEPTSLEGPAPDRTTEAPLAHSAPAPSPSHAPAPGRRM